MIEIDSVKRLRRRECNMHNNNTADTDTCMHAYAHRLVTALGERTTTTAAAKPIVTTATMIMTAIASIRPFWKWWTHYRVFRCKSEVSDCEVKRSVCVLLCVLCIAASSKCKRNVMYLLYQHLDQITWGQHSNAPCIFDATPLLFSLLLLCVWVFLSTGFWLIKLS